MTAARSLMHVVVPLLLVFLSVYAGAAQAPAPLDASPVPAGAVDATVSTTDTGVEFVPNIPAAEPPILFMLMGGLGALYLLLRRREQRRRAISVQFKPAGERTAIGARQVAED